jgi:hypothetical protein
VAEGKVELVERSTASARDLPRDFPIAGLATELRNLTLRNLTPGTLQDR